MQPHVITFRKFTTTSVCFFLCIFSIKSLSFSFIPISSSSRARALTMSSSSFRNKNPAIDSSSSCDAVVLFQPTVSLTGAATQKALLAAEHYAASQGWKVTIAIVDAGGTPLLVKRCDGAFAASYTIAVEKAKSAALFCKNTGELEAAVNNIIHINNTSNQQQQQHDGMMMLTSRAALLSTPFCLMRGGVPIMVNDICCGAIGVSGVKPDQDEQIAMAAVAALNNNSILISSKL